jgi:predicted DNA-binding transcriptional regulator YafY
MQISNREVEPYAFSTNYADVYAYEIATGQNKIFKVCRIGWVKPTCYLWEHEEKHEVISPDCFRMNGKESIPVTLRMTLMAKNLLIEEYPLSMRDISYKDGYWLLNTVVKDLAGVGRFYLGLSDQIEIIDSPKLESYVKRRVRKDLAKFI